jgi:ectoine hydroxylase-related dioxygenase (phytanoyl-CoA dioxygenase family)
MDKENLVSETKLERSHPVYNVSVEEYLRFQRDGYLVVRGLVAREEVEELLDYTDGVIDGRIKVPGIDIPADMSEEERRNYWTRLHMPHRSIAIHERFLLHPRIIDVLEALIGPDVLALQTMLFFKLPGQPGQGYHQDAYYIPAQPDTLCGAWLALDRATIENGCLWMAVGSQHEPIYPDNDGVSQHGNRVLGDIQPIRGASNPDPNENTLAQVASKYTEVPVEAEPGDVVFFGGHVIHRSEANVSDRPRRSFVGHYCNARSRVPWNHGIPYPGEKEGSAANHVHILARGTTHLDYAQPRFGTPCAANLPEIYGERKQPGKAKAMMPSKNGLMILLPHAEEDHDD